MFSSSSRSTRSSCNPNRSPITNPMSTTLAPYMTSTFQPSGLNNHICSTCFRAFATFQASVAHQASHRQQTKEFCTHPVCMEQAFHDGAPPPPESIGWVTPAEGCSSENKRRKVLKVMPSAELTLATGAAPDMLLEMDESDNLEFYLKM